MFREQLEKVFEKGGVKPITRRRVGDHDVFIGEGFSLSPHRIYWKFGVTPADFKLGMYATWWWLAKGEKLDAGQPLFFDVLHNPEISVGSKQMARVNTALREAEKFLKDRRTRARAN